MTTQRTARSLTVALSALSSVIALGTSASISAQSCETPAWVSVEEPGNAPDITGFGAVAYSYEIDNGGRVRGVVWDKHDPKGPMIRITGAFYLPEPGAWTPFSALDDGPLLTTIPVSTQDLAHMIGIP